MLAMCIKSKFQNDSPFYFLFSLSFYLALCCISEGSECNQNPYIKDAGPLVETKSGTIIGKNIKVFDANVATFQGIPFAKPPLDDLRFRKPIPIEQWEGTLFATEKPPACMQHSSRNYPWIPSAINKSEDCLYLNIWVPTKCFNNFENLPVMVWIYGGAFYSGSSSMDVYDGSILASYGEVIIVSINYRVGLFGFFNGGTEEAPGNVGLHDQILALKWVKENIESFGGDPKKITLFGESAGAISVSLHTISPLSIGLFNKAIMQSGSAYHPNMVENSAISLYKASIFSQLSGCSNENINLMKDSKEVINCLKLKNPIELAHVENALTDKFPYFFAPYYGATCVECNDILPTSPIAVLQAKNFSHVPTLIGTNENEGSLFYTYIMPDIFNASQTMNFTIPQARDILKSMFSFVPDISPEIIFSFYFKNVTNEAQILKALTNAFGDFTFTCPTYFYAEKMKESYFYWITHRSTNDQRNEWIGVTHFDEIPYVFGKPIVENELYTHEDGKFSASIIQKWASFAHNGHPLDEKNKQMWPRFYYDYPIVYEMNSRNEKCIPFPRQEACEFWRPFFHS